jgi:SAM-dependent methyltransferase
MKKKFLRSAGVFMLLDATFLILFGHRYVERTRFGSEGNPYYRLMSWFLQWPDWLLRLAGLAEAGLGLAVLGSAPLQVRSLYGRIAGAYSVIDTAWREWLYRDAHRQFDRAMAQSLPADGRVLDLGAGTGANLGRLLALGLPFASYTGVDLTGEMLEQARQKYGHLPNVHFRQLDLMSDALPEGPYNLIVSTWALEHMPDPVHVVEKAWGELQTGGHMVLLFEAEADNWYSRLEDRVLDFFSARQVREEEIRRFPGLQRRESYDGAFGRLALVVLEKKGEKGTVGEGVE